MATTIKDERLRTIATFDGNTLKDDRLRTIATFDGKILKDDRLNCQSQISFYIIRCLDRII